MEFTHAAVFDNLSLGERGVSSEGKSGYPSHNRCHFSSSFTNMALFAGSD